MNKINQTNYPQSFTGKERDSETGFSYFGARYYDSDLMTGWLSVDPMADKYPSLSPYAYCGWNPIRLVDPDGEDIEIVDTDGKKYTWTITGKIYYGSLCINNQAQTQNVKNKLNMLNKIYATSAGKKVLQELVSAEETYSITNESPTNKNAPASYSGVENKFKMGKSNDISVFAHELFHAYQDANGRGGPSIYNEVEAYVFQKIITNNLGIKDNNLGLSAFKTNSGNKFSKAINSLVDKFNVYNFLYAIKEFKAESEANSTGAYVDYPLLNKGNFLYKNSLLEKIR